MRAAPRRRGVEGEDGRMGVCGLQGFFENIKSKNVDFHPGPWCHEEDPNEEERSKSYGFSLIYIVLLGS